MFSRYHFLPFSTFYPFLRFSFLFSYFLLSLVSTSLVCDVIVHILYTLFIVIVIRIISKKTEPVYCSRYFNQDVPLNAASIVNQNSAK